MVKITLISKDNGLVEQLQVFIDTWHSIALLSRSFSYFEVTDPTRLCQISDL